MDITSVLTRNKNIILGHKSLSTLGKNFFGKMSQITSGLAHIELSNQNALQLFQEWYEEANSKSFASIMNLATATKDGRVSNRNVIMREIKEDGVTFCTPQKGKKCKHIEENPHVSVCFFWKYDEENRNIVRQVRMEGTAQKLPHEETSKYFKTEPTFCQIRSHICAQGDTVEWDQLKEKHDKLLKQVTEGGIKLDMPEDYVGYKVVPMVMDFYHSYENHIADRIIFKQENGEWKYNRVCT